jgi:hypothetical protein
MRLELHPEARAELRSAALWYDEQRPGLGDEFIADVPMLRTQLKLERLSPAFSGRTLPWLCEKPSTRRRRDGV